MTGNGQETAEASQNGGKAAVSGSVKVVGRENAATGESEHNAPYQPCPLRELLGEVLAGEHSGRIA